ncbi:MAG: ATP-dependent sacrificial sulfur transferase LarE [Candidatus Bathyarchaeota archaeon]|nr:ATP-dependent sacrificial sulfur transferase LarE [Candidatus Bathyarchaeota archaeon]
MGENLKRKLDELKAYIADKGKDGVVIAFSGGVDSTTLAAVTHQVLGKKAVAVIAHSPTYTEEEMRSAKRTALSIGIKLYVTLTHELQNEDFAKNPENRCYFCKRELLEKLSVFARDHGFGAVFDGTNYSDLGEHRPGFKAIQEAKGVYTPWVFCKFSKNEIRALAKQMGLSVHDRPASPCLASRIPYNERITAEKLARIEKAEEAIRQIVNVQELRVRDHEGLARIEVAALERKLFFDQDVLDRVAAALKKLGYRYVALDLEGYQRGNMLRAL